MAEMASHELLPDERDFVAKYAARPSDLPPEEVERIQKIIRDLRVNMLRLPRAFHLNEEDAAEFFSNLFGRPHRILQYLDGQVKEKREGFENGKKL